MNITLNLNQILDVLKPGRTTFAFDGKTYLLKRFAIIDAQMLGGVRARNEGEPLAQYQQRVADTLRGLFDGDAPPFVPTKVDAITDTSERCLAIDRMRVLLAAVASSFMDEIDREKKEAELAWAETKRQIETTQTSTTPSPT